MTAHAAPRAEARPALNHVAIMVPDIDAALDWYATHLGATVIDRWAEASIGMAWAHLAIGNFVLELVGRSDFIADPGKTFGFHHLGIEVDDCDETVARMREGGVEVMRDPSDFERHRIRWAFVRDNNGNVLEILSPLDR